MTTLRRSCHNCTTSKRHCSIELPGCARCVQRGLACTYDLQPLNGADTRKKRSAGQLLTEPNFNTGGYCFLGRAESYNEIYGEGLDPALTLPGK